MHCTVLHEMPTISYGHCHMALYIWRVGEDGHWSQDSSDVKQDNDVDKNTSEHVYTHEYDTKSLMASRNCVYCL
jgi:hypothetical protein